MSAAAVNTSVESAITAMEAGEWSSAIRSLMAAKARLIALPDAIKGQMQLRWDRQAIDDLIAECRREQAVDAAGSNESTGGVLRRVPITYESESSDEC